MKPKVPAANDKSQHKAGRTRSGTESPAPTDRGIRAVARMERLAYEARSPIDRVASAITRKAGSGAAILLHVIWFTAWILLNTGVLGAPSFDPFPFSLLTTIVSLEAIFLTLFVLISQNRMSQEADKRAELDLQVNVLSEMEATTILRILNDICLHLGVKGSAGKDLAEFLKETRLDELARKLDRELPPEK